MSVSVNVRLADGPWADLSPYPVVAGDAISFVFNVVDVSQIANDGNLATYLLLDNDSTPSSDLTGSTTLAATASVQSKALPTNLTGGSTYVLAVYGTCDGEVRCCGKITLLVQDKGDPQ